jgi:23S rRNA pseudouridine2457 synthase
MPVILLNKPFQVLTRFTDPKGRATLADYVDRPGFYPAGRLDFDSEGLLVLTDDGALQHRISDPRHKLPKIYWAQVEGEPSAEALRRLAEGVELRDGRSAPAEARRLPAPTVWERDPPIRYRASIPTTWLEIILREGRNRQVRRMTAAVGHPTLRLIRQAVGPWSIAGLAPGEWRDAAPETLAAVIRGGGRRSQQRRRRSPPRR